MAAGVLRQRSTLDAQLAPLVPRGWTSVAPDLQDILRLGAYQLTALQRVPAHAAVDTSVSLAKASGGPRAAGFVNAVLRSLTRSETRVETGGVRDAAALAVEYSHPRWLVRRWLGQFGTRGTEDLLRWNNTRPRLAIQAARGDLESLRIRLQAGGVEVEAAPYDAGLVVGSSRPERLPGYGDGQFVVQNPAQSLIARFANLPPGSTVYDACAAPGGKTVALGRSARMVVAGDVSPSRARRLQENLARAGSGREQVIVADGRRPPLRPTNAVVMDVPCLGTGTFARHPDARWRVTPEALDSLVRLQAELLDRSAAVVAPGGLLVYSTCSLEPEENQSQVERFLQAHPEFRREATDAVSPDLLSPEGDLMILPQRHGTDGAYAARLRRNP
ncbi:MAG: rRNA (cytosine967-C5)-methyltransferase [Gemmatimonadales bacterium]|nr:rRNA (cytosine967-C5)-methyltransferase [Gemmatimonadales bacterium]